ncbi:MAG: DJ-1/PfpI family protein [bacterium]|nr:DJ-1/PfpI family protein [bacterium]
MINVAILIFDQVEVLDFAGPFEVFNAVGDWQGGEKRFNVYTVAETADAVRARGSLTIVPHFSIDSAPPPHVVVVPGGAGSRRVMERPAVLAWIQAQYEAQALTTSVCTGARVLAKVGLLDGLKATTHWEALDELGRFAPHTEIVRGVRFVDNGRVITSAGVQAGMDMALHIVARLTDSETARMTARYIEYEWDATG